MDGLLAALAFLTRIPLPARPFAARAQAASLAWYPFVGLLLGLLFATLAWLLRDAPPMTKAIVVLIVWVAATGALHLDGLADSADAWIGGLGDRERTLTIMKDPRCGPAGVTALVLLLLGKFAALAGPLQMPWTALLLAPLLARASLVALFLCTPYVREGGIGSGLVEAPRSACLLAVGATVIGCGLSGGRGLLALGVAGAVFACWRHVNLRRLGGFTGDTAGALVEMIEAAVLLTLMAHA